MVVNEEVTIKSYRALKARLWRLDFILREGGDTCQRLRGQLRGLTRDLGNTGRAASTRLRLKVKSDMGGLHRRCQEPA